MTISIITVLFVGLFTITSQVSMATDDSGKEDNSKSTADTTNPTSTNNDPTSSDILPTVSTCSNCQAVEQPTATCDATAKCATGEQTLTEKPRTIETEPQVVTTNTDQNSLVDISNLNSNSISQQDNIKSSGSSSSSKDSTRATDSDGEGVWLDPPTKVFAADGSQVLFYQYSSNNNVGAYITVPGTHHHQLALREIGLYFTLEDAIRDLDH